MEHTEMGKWISARQIEREFNIRRQAVSGAKSTGRLKETLEISPRNVVYSRAEVEKAIAEGRLVPGGHRKLGRPRKSETGKVRRGKRTTVSDAMFRDIVQKILKEAASKTVREIADEFGVRQSVVASAYRIMKREGWKPPQGGSAHGSRIRAVRELLRGSGDTPVVVQRVHFEGAI